MQDQPIHTESNIQDIPFVILAGGLGTRLRPVLSDRPKALAPIGDKPFLEILIRLLQKQGAHRFVLCVGYMANEIRRCLGRGERLGVAIEYSVEQENKLLGTGGALREAGAFIEQQAVLLNGDTYLPIDYRALLAAHQKRSAPQITPATLALSLVNEAESFGRVKLSTRQDRIVAFNEKAGSDHPIDTPTGKNIVNAGVYVLDRHLLDFIPPQRRCSLEHEVFPDILDRGYRLDPYLTDQMFFDIGTPESLGTFERLYIAGETSYP